MPVGMDEIADLIVQEKGPPFVKTIKSETFLLSRLSEKGMVREGRPNLGWKANYAGNAAVSSYGEGDPAAGSGKQLVKSPTLAYKAVRGEVGMSGIALATSEAGGTIVDDLLFELDGTMRDMRKAIDTQLLGDGLGNSGKDITGILAGVADSGIYAGLDRGVDTWWKSYVLEAGGVPRNLTEALISTALDEVLVRGANRRTLEIWAAPKHWRQYGDLLKGERRQTPTSLTGGYQALDFEGVPVIQVPGYAAGQMDVVDVSQIDYNMLPVTANTPLARELRAVRAFPGVPGFGILLLGAAKDALEMWLIHYAQLRVLNPYVMASIQDLA